MGWTASPLKLFPLHFSEQQSFLHPSPCLSATVFHPLSPPRCLWFTFLPLQPGPWTDSWEPPAHWEIQYVRLYPSKCRLGCFLSRSSSHPSDQRVHLAPSQSTPPQHFLLGGSQNKSPVEIETSKMESSLGMSPSTKGEGKGSYGRPYAFQCSPCSSAWRMARLPCRTSAPSPPHLQPLFLYRLSDWPRADPAKFCWPLSGPLHCCSHGLEHPSLHSLNYTLI